MNQPSHTIDNRSLAIGVLSITAVILFVGFLLVTLTPRQAQAGNMNDRSGDYIMTTQSLSSSREGVLILDAAAKVMVLYAYDQPAKELLVLDRFILGEPILPEGERNQD